VQPSLTPQDLVAKWRKADLKERSAAQEHFIELCHLVSHPTPAEADPTGQTFTFEAGATKSSGGLLAWLRGRRKCVGNGHQHREWWYIGPTGERRRIE
jgi:hypothetical protein